MLSIDIQDRDDQNFRSLAEAAVFNDMDLIKLQDQAEEYVRKVKRRDLRRFLAGSFLVRKIQTFGIVAGMAILLDVKEVL